MKKKCEHKLVYNENEDFVFCEKCGKRWSNGVNYITTPYHYPYYYGKQYKIPNDSPPYIYCS